MSVGHTCAVTGRRVCALLAVCSAGLHVMMLGHAGSLAVAGLLIVMLGVCLFCAWELWRDGSVRAWMLVALMNLGMVAVHSSSVGHRHGAPLQLTSTSTSALMAAATAVAVIEVLAAASVLFYRTRGRAERLGAGRSELA